MSLVFSRHNLENLTTTGRFGGQKQKKKRKRRKPRQEYRPGMTKMFSRSELYFSGSEEFSAHACLIVELSSLNFPSNAVIQHEVQYHRISQHKRRTDIYNPPGWIRRTDV